MACKYHPNAISLKKCENCGSYFCNQCSDKILCLDCAAAIAKKMIVRSYIAAGIGFVIGLMAGVTGVKESGVAVALFVALFSPIFTAYGFWGWYWGWQYGGRVWPWLARASSKLEGSAGMLATFFLLWLRLTFSFFFGIFGGGIVGFLWCRNTVNRQEQFAANLRVVSQR
jgi:hypothetical protein